MNILFIDSGIGGITTLCEVVKHIPNINFIYYADDKYSPYGNLPASIIFDRVKNIIDSQLKNHVGMVVLACNTATASAIDNLRKFYPFAIIGIEPAIKVANKKGNSVLVLATPTTTKNKRFARLVLNCKCNIEIAPMKALARQIDNYFLYGDVLSKDEIDITVDYIAKISQNKTHIVLGCTHYVHLQSLIASKTKAKVIDGNFGVYKKISSVILPQMLSKNPVQKFILSSNNSDISKKYKKIFEQTLSNNQ